MIKIAKYDVYYYYFVSIVIILSSWTIYYTLPFGNLTLAFVVILMVSRRSAHFEKTIFLTALLLSFVIIRNFLPTNFNLFDKQFYYSFIQMALLIMILLLSQNDRWHIYEKFILLITIIVTVGLFFHIFQILGHPLLKRIMIAGVGKNPRHWAVYYTHSNFFYHGVEQIYRFSSIFDEPGYLGTILAFILTVERYNLHKIRNLLLFIAGIFTLSGAFIAITLIYFSLNAIYVKNLRKYLISLLVGIVIISILYQLFPEMFSIITDRLVIIPGQGFVDDRANISKFKQYIDSLAILDNTSLFWGTNRFMKPSDVGIFMGHVSWVHLVVRIGLFFFIYLILVLLYLAKRSKNFFVLMYVIIFIFSVNYRPQIFNPIYFFLLSCGLLQKRDISN